MTATKLEIERLRWYWATFNPKRTDDLQNDGAAFIGRRMKWQAVWIIEADIDPYAGQWAMSPHPDAGAAFVWAPECDLDDIEEARKG